MPPCVLTSATPAKSLWKGEMPYMLGISEEGNESLCGVCGLPSFLPHQIGKYLLQHGSASNNLIETIAFEAAVTNTILAVTL